VHAPCEDEGNDVKGSFHKDLGHVFEQFPRYDMKILLSDFSVKVGRGNIFKPTIGNESLHEISNDSGVRVVNFATYKNLGRKWHSSILDVRSFRGADCDCLVVAKVRERLAVSKQAAQKIDTERFIIKKLDEGKLMNSIRLQSETSLQLWKT
jgi:hypothetical protein